MAAKILNGLTAAGRFGLGHSLAKFTYTCVSKGY